MEHSVRGLEESAKSELKERGVAVASGSANHFKRIAVSHGHVTIVTAVKTESTAIRF